MAAYTLVTLSGEIVGYTWGGMLGELPINVNVNNDLIREVGFKGAIEMVLRDLGGNFDGPSISDTTQINIIRTNFKTNTMRIVQEKSIPATRFMGS